MKRPQFFPQVIDADRPGGASGQPSSAVFLSYARNDLPAAQRMRDALVASRRKV